MVLDHEQCYRAVTSRDPRFDGYFVGAVRTTGIYCRPSCPAVTPKRANIEFFPTAAAAHEHGYRACKRCRPDASPGSPEWDVRGDVVARAMRLIGDGVVDRDGVSGLARRLHYSERHLNRLITDELGAGPLAIARAQRATTARVLIETSSMPFTAIAFAAGFRSIRQFNDTVQAVFAASPSQLRATPRRRRRGAPPTATAGSVIVDLAVRQPFDLQQVMSFLAAPGDPGVESFDGDAYPSARWRCPTATASPRSTATLVVKSGRAHVRVRRSASPTGATSRRPCGVLRRLLDLDADPDGDRRGARRRPVARPARRPACPGCACRAASIRSRRRCAPSSASRSPSPGRAPSPDASSRAVGVAADASATTRSPTCSRRPARWPPSTQRCCRCRCAAGRRSSSWPSGSPSARSCSTPVPTATTCGTPCSTCPASARGPPTTCCCAASATPTCSCPPTSASSRPSPSSVRRADAAERWRPWRSYALHHLWERTLIL